MKCILLQPAPHARKQQAILVQARADADRSVSDLARLSSLILFAQSASMYACAQLQHMTGSLSWRSKSSLSAYHYGKSQVAESKNRHPSPVRRFGSVSVEPQTIQLSEIPFHTQSLDVSGCPNHA